MKPNVIVSFIEQEHWHEQLHEDKEHKLHEALALLIYTFLCHCHCFDCVGQKDALQRFQSEPIKEPVLMKAWNSETKSYIFQLKHERYGTFLLKMIPFRKLLLVHLGSMANETIAALEFEYVF